MDKVYTDIIDLLITQLTNRYDMLIQKFDTEKIVDLFCNFSKNGNSRMSIFDLKLLITIINHPGNSLTEYARMIKPGCKGKSSLDKPIQRLINYGFVDVKYRKNTATKLGNSYVHYYISKNGEKMLKKCSI